ncbi:MAG TPA: radical SAM protein [Pyrinomonadaceae bacterium]|nr:radical SAM protein [Pyrinomonadaceae bacterium]
MPWTVGHVPVLPSWFCLLRLDRWREAASAQTPEFFLLRNSSGRSFVRLDRPALQFDEINWAGDLIIRSATLLAADYEAVRQDPDLRVPAQFQVFNPGSRPSSVALPPTGQHPRFTVICPSIRPDFLKETVESVLAQTFTDWELRIGIDGPKEIQFRKMAALLDHLKEDTRIHIRRYPHLGTGPARGRLAAESRGEFIMTLDDDDRLAPTILERFASAIDEHPGVALVRGGTRLFGLYEAYLPPRTRFRVGPISNDLFEVNQPFAVRRSTLESFGGFEWDPALRNAGEDSDLFLKIDRAELPVVTIDEPLYERRLSTLNQTLDCTSEQCSRHINFLYGKHESDGWQLNDVRFRDRGAHVGMLTAHRRDGNSETIVCSTEFMNFHQVGSRDGIVLDLEVTSLCNADCTFCPRTSLERNARFMSRKTVERVAESLRLERGNPLVVLAGIGESTLHPELNEIVKMLTDAGARVCLTTNGWNLNEELLDALVSAGLGQLNVSVNATTAETHAAVMRLKNFDSIVATCHSIARKRAIRWPNLEFHVSLVVTDRNESEAIDFVEQWRTAGVSQIWLHRLTNRRGLLSPDCRPGNLEALAERYAGDPKVVVDMFPDRDGPTNLCRVANDIDFISVDGEMLLCAQDYESRHRFGNIEYAQLDRLHGVKLLAHLRGETAGTCAGCTFCPPSFRDGYNPTYSIVQASAVSNGDQSLDEEDELGNVEELSAVSPPTTPAAKPETPPEGFLCRSPFEYVHIQANGDTYPCCPSKFAKIIGNVKKISLREAWNSEEAKAVRESIIDGSYKFCNADACEYLRDVNARGIPLSPQPLVDWAKQRGLLETGETPNVANFSFDKSCNLECGYCRTELFHPNAEEREVIGRIDTNIFDTSLADTERIILLGEGDPFASPFYKEKLRHYDWSRHPKLKIKIQTNGLLLTPAMWNSIARSHNAIDWISVSVDAADAETYRLNRGGDFNLLLRNLDFIANLRALGHIDRFFVNFLVQANNFRQMPAFARLGQQLGADLIEFQRLENWGTYDEPAYRARAVHESFHSDYDEFRCVLEDPALQLEAVWLLKLGAQPPGTDVIGVVSCKGDQ